MNKELTDRLLEKYPSLYPATFKFYHGDGWYFLIEKLSEKLQNYPVKIVQVKEKFGGLRYYVEYATPISIISMADINNLISETESESFHTCEMTGNIGRLCKSRGKTWFKTLSEEKAKELDYEPYIRGLNNGS